MWKQRGFRKATWKQRGFGKAKLASTLASVCFPAVNRHTLDLLRVSVLGTEHWTWQSSALGLCFCSAVEGWAKLEKGDCSVGAALHELGARCAGQQRR